MREKKLKETWKRRDKGLFFRVFGANLEIDKDVGTLSGGVKYGWGE